MSLLRWKELAKSKSELGDKINYVHDVITKHNIGQQTSQESFEKVFKPVTSKLDEVIESNLDLKMHPRKKQPLKKVEVPDYGVDFEDEDWYLDELPKEQPVSTDTEKQIVPLPSTYEDSSEDILEGKEEIYADPQYFPEDTQELTPEMKAKLKLTPEMEAKLKLIEATFKKFNLPNYKSVDMKINETEMEPIETKRYLNKIIDNAISVRRKFGGYKTDVTKKFITGKINEDERAEQNKQLDDERKVLNDYIEHYDTKFKQIKGSGIKGRGRKKRGGNVMFFNDPKQLLNKLELIIGEVIAGNTSIKMRNMGVNILDTLLRMATINRPQYNKLYYQYFKV